MDNKKYPAVYRQIQEYYTLIAKMDGNLPEDYAERRTRNAYRIACSHIREGKYTEEQIIACYPLD